MPSYFKESQRPAPKIAKLDIRIIPDPQTQIAEMMSGGLDFVMGVAADQAQAMAAAPNMQVVEGETMRIVFLNLNTQETTPTPALRDKRVREAIMHAIDRETMVKQLVGQKAKVIEVNCFPSQFGCDDSQAVKRAMTRPRPRPLWRKPASRTALMSILLPIASATRPRR
jgi:peptide/nickel transport system substrate-binding protein